MKRREILKYTALITGAAVTAPLAFSLSSCKSDVTKLSNYKSQFFSEEEFAFISTVVDKILPRTDSPSATDVGVDQMIDQMVNNVYTSDNQREYRESFKALFEHFGQDGEIDEQSLLDIENRDQDSVRKGYQQLKQQTVAYYLTTKEVGTKFLNYLPVPGEYEGCIDLSSVDGKAWAL